jgi:hypothetical protein
LSHHQKLQRYSQRYSFFGIVALLVLGLQWWASHMGNLVPVSSQTAESTDQATTGLASADAPARRALLEVFDRMVVHEKYYHSVYGRYTKVLSRIDFTVPRSVANQYEVRVVEADENRLLITAFSEEDGKTLDSASIDQGFRVESNFPAPAPRPEYLKIHAFKQLRLMFEADGQAVAEEGVFKDFFRYEIRRDSRDQAVAFAIGVKPPVLGLELQADRHDLLITEDSQSNLRRLTELMPENRPSASSDSDDDLTSAVGQTSDGMTIATAEEALLAQKAQQGDWADLWNITRFPIDEKEPDRRTAGEVPPTRKGGLVIEPIRP